MTALVAAPASTTARTPHVSGSSVAAARIVIGLVGAVSCARFLLNGWVDAFWIDPVHHFTWPGLWWVRPLPAGWMHAVVAGVGASFLTAAWRAWRGRNSREWMCAAAIGFTYLGAIDIAPYLNHYVLLVLAAIVAATLADGAEVPVETLVPLRIVVGSTYLWAAVAKVDGDWLSGRTIRPWLATHVDWPLVGVLFRHGSVAQLLAIAGLLFDLLVAPALLVRRTRPYAYAAVVAFHLATALLFPIGMFPWLMIGLTTVFFAPGWFSRWWLGEHRAPPRAASAPSRFVIGALVVLAVIPLRGYLSDVGWSEHGGRFAWRVMATNKVGVAELYVVPASAADSDAFVVQPARDLSPLQAQQVTWQPDLILQWAHLVARIEEERLGEPVRVHADVWVSVNGAESRQLIDPTVDLADERWTLRRPDWVLPAP